MHMKLVRTEDARCNLTPFKAKIKVLSLHPGILAYRTALDVPKAYYKFIQLYHTYITKISWQTIRFVQIWT
jgi:hypothetical protein